MVKCRTFLILAVWIGVVWGGAVFAQSAPSQGAFVPKIKEIKGHVNSGATISSLLKKYLPLKTIYQVCDQSKKIYPLSRIKKGQPYRLMVSDNELTAFEYEIDTEKRLVVTRDAGHFSIVALPIEYDVQSEYIMATIKYSLNGTIRKIGEKNELACRLADIFAWDIDFIRDIQSGDAFKVLVEKKYKDGQFRGYGDILAAFFTNRSKVFKAFFYTDANGSSGYYDEKGNSLQKAFLKAPLAYSRISSKFSKKRLHPVLHTVKPHLGVDYAAPTGTPVKTVGDGTIEMVGYNKSAGKYIRVRHPNGYTTSYFHLSKFAKGMKKNRRLGQGQVIGFVGQSGYATGPHLCFRLKKNGCHIDPLKYRSPSAEPVHPDEMERFQAKIMALSRSIAAASKALAALEPSST